MFCLLRQYTTYLFRLLKVCKSQIMRCKLHLTVLLVVIIGLIQVEEIALNMIVITYSIEVIYSTTQT